MSYTVYILECKDGSLYTGITTNMQRRFTEHNLGKGGAYTRAKKVRKLRYTEKHTNRSNALKREAQIKSWIRKKKLALIHSKSNTQIDK
jgi:putative endonuclease